MTTIYLNQSPFDNLWRLLKENALMVTQGKVSPEELERFYASTDQASLAPGWLRRGEERPTVVPVLWKWSAEAPALNKSA